MSHNLESGKKLRKKILETKKLIEFRSNSTLYDNQDSGRLVLIMAAALQPWEERPSLHDFR